MKPKLPQHPVPKDADARRLAPKVICYDPTKLQLPLLSFYHQRRSQAKAVKDILVTPRTASCFQVEQGNFFRIECVEGSQVGDLNLWNANQLIEHFYSGKTRAFHGTHVSSGDRLWSNFPFLCPLATIVDDSLDWYGFDQDGASVHDVIGTRCDPYSYMRLNPNLEDGQSYERCCHSNLMRAMADYLNIPEAEAEPYIHDVLNVFMCTGFDLSTHQYFMKASPARSGDYIEFYAEVNLLGALSTCPGGDCGQEHSSDVAKVCPLKVTIYSR